MQKKNALIALVILSAVGLGACSKNNKHGLRARAEAAKASGNPTKMGDEYTKNQESVDKDIAALKEMGVSFGVFESIKSKIFGSSVDGSKRDDAKKKLNSIMYKADTMIGLAKDMHDDNLKEKAEGLKNKAATSLQSIEKQEQDEKADAQKDAQKTGKDQNPSASEEKNFLGF